MEVSDRPVAAASPTPEYAVFDDYRATQGILVLVRWCFIVYGLYVTNVRPTFDETHMLRNNAILGTVALLNVYLHWHVLRERRIGLPTVLLSSIVDALAITTIIMFSETPAFSNPFYFVYFPIVLSYALVFPRGPALGYSLMVALAYGVLSLVLAPGVDVAARQEKVLLGRMLTIVAAALVGVLIVNGERALRHRALEAEQARSRENLDLQRRAQEAELRAQTERSQIRREIHDGIAQSIYMLSLQLETSADLVARDRPELRERLEGLVKLAREALLEARQYIFDLKPLLAGERTLTRMLENQVKEFQAVTSIPVRLKVEGEVREAPIPVAAALYRIAQEALANVYKHAGASSVEVALSFEAGKVALGVRDDGLGFSAEAAAAGSGGQGLLNIRQRAAEQRGSASIQSAPGRGTEITVELPLEED